MKLVLVLASLLLSAPVAFAQNQSADADVDYFELEVGSMPYDEAMSLSSNNTMELNRRDRRDDGDRGAEIIGGIIGGVIGGIIDNGRGGGGWGDDGGWGGGRNRDVVCYARDRRGNVYRAAGPNPRRVQDRALAKCERNARFCRAQGCRPL